MAERPFGPWQPVEGATDDRHWLVREYGHLYMLLGQVGVKRKAARKMRPWEAAARLGVGLPDAPEAGGSVTPGVARAVERMRAAAEGRPDPEPVALTPAMLGMLAPGQVG